jgi:hypothetical protein
VSRYPEFTSKLIVGRTAGQSTTHWKIMRRRTHWKSKAEQRFGSSVEKRLNFPRQPQDSLNSTPGKSQQRILYTCSVCGLCRRCAARLR